jgi:hypothetical protein
VRAPGPRLLKLLFGARRQLALCSKASGDEIRHLLVLGGSQSAGAAQYAVFVVEHQ